MGQTCQVFKTWQVLELLILFIL